MTPKLLDSKASKTVGQVPVKDIVIDYRVQRAQLNVQKLNAMVSDFDENALGVLIVSQRNDNSYVCLDGWHRAEACKLVPEAPTKLDAIIFKDLTLEEEARLFRLYNTRATMHTIDQFNAAVYEGLDQAVRITDIVHSYGLKVHANSFACVAAAKRIVEYPDGYQRLDITLNIINQVWGLEEGSLDYRIVEGIATYLRYHGDRVKVTTLVKRLQEMADEEGVNVGFKDIIATATPYHKAKGGPVRLAVADVINKHYNRYQKPENKLPDIQR
jgi:hypothetical protein